MERDAFESLVSAWLDDPADETLRARLEQAERETPTLRAVREQWQRCEALLRQGASGPAGVVWARVQAHIAAAVAADEQVDVGLDALLAAPAGLEQRVVWQRLRARIAAACAAAPATPALRYTRRRVWWTSVSAAALATAAALLLAFWPHAGPGTQAPGLATFTVAAKLAPVPSGVVVVRIAAGDVSEFQPEPEAYFSIEPAPRTAAVEQLPDIY